VVCFDVASDIVEEIFDAELNQVYDCLIDVPSPRPVPSTEVLTATAFTELVFCNSAG